MQLWYIKIDICVAVTHNMLLVTSVRATRFGCTDYPHAFDTSYVKLKTKCIYILNL